MMKAEKLGGTLLNKVWLARSMLETKSALTQKHTNNITNRIKVGRVSKARELLAKVATSSAVSADDKLAIQEAKSDFRVLMSSKL